MNIFKKAALKSILDDKVTSGEITFYSMDGGLLTIGKSKGKKRGRGGLVSIYKIDVSGLSDDELIKVLYRDIPDNVNEHFKIEIRNVKIRSII